MKFNLTPALIGAAIAAATVPASASATLITFAAATGTPTAYVESGYRFVGTPLVAINGALGNAATNAKITVSRVDGGLFTIGSIDVASQIGVMFADNMDLLFDFVLANGSQTSDYRVLTLALSGEQQFSTFSDFAGMQLKSFSVYSLTNSGSGLIKIDNLNVNAVAAAVPEPASWALMIAGFGMIGTAARRRAKVNPTVRFT